MKSILPYFVFLLLVHSAACSSLAAEKSIVHDPAAHAGAGLKKELTAGITEADFLRLGDKPKTIKVTLVTAYNEVNSWMNFNGYSHGQAVYTIPIGWTVEVTFINPSPSPHSAIVVERGMLKKMQVGEPAFKGASVPHPITGVSLNKATFSFIADESGEYAFACGVPTHATIGHWLALNVSPNAKGPTLKLGNTPAKGAK